MSQEQPIRMTPLTENAVMLHEIFQSLLAAGFTEWQAARILGVFLAESGRQQ